MFDFGMFALEFFWRQVQVAKPLKELRRKDRKLHAIAETVEISGFPLNNMTKIPTPSKKYLLNRRISHPLHFC